MSVDDTDPGPVSPIAIVAAVIQDEGGRVLLVRKRGTRAFMQPGGKRDGGEDDLQVLVRELREELGCELEPGSAIFLGTHEADAANEPGRCVRAALYAVRLRGEPLPRAEIEELAWVNPRTPSGLPLAPLTRDAVLPLLTSSEARQDKAARHEGHGQETGQV